MKMIRLGKTNYKVNKNGFGALPIQRRNKKDSIEIIQKAYNNGINFYDTARFYTDSEEKLGASLNEVRENVIIATKTGAENAEDFWKDLETSLKNLQTEYVEIYQFHNLPFCPKPNDGSGLYEAMLEAKDEGKIKHIGITSHKFTIAKQALSSGLYETLQFPFSYLTDVQELNLVEKCKKLDVGFLAMKAMGGGLITNSKYQIDCTFILYQPPRPVNSFYYKSRRLRRLPLLLYYIWFKSIISSPASLPA